MVLLHNQCMISGVIKDQFISISVAYTKMLISSAQLICALLSYLQKDAAFVQ